ncbi:histidine kinase [Vallitalea pronyensis]|uniref:Histidine kinase n=1 Tax=Vallitalea pronyensis TaxID=1348613 RepID=A0A8J8MPN8_9FIRM|nr:sensor histidine kinase [Vallitalea pronyensis]QUI25266.1 histidine kinase [Vallitalea pronyensis]
MTLTFRRKILIFYILLVVFPLLVISSVIISKVSDVLYTKEEYIAGNKITQIKDKLDAYCEGVESLSYDITFNKEMQEIVKKEYDPYRFAFHNSEYMTFTNLFGINRMEDHQVLFLKLQNNHKQDVFSIGSLHRSVPVLEAEFMNNPHNYLWTDVYKSLLYKPSETINVLSFYRKIIDPNRFRELGMLRIDIQESTLRHLYHNDLWSPNKLVFILNNNGQVLSSNRVDYIASNMEHIVQDRETINHQKIYIVDGIDYLVVSKKLDTGPWELVWLIPTHDFDGEIDAVKNYINIILITMIIFAIVLSSLFSKSITKPIHRLTHTMQEVKDGNLNVQFISKSNDEIKVLGNRFNEMISQINLLMDRLYAMKAEKEISESLYLQSQINPHFLYNTLDSIRWMARQNKDFEVSFQLEALSNLFRHMLNEGNIFTRFRDELQHLDDYMKIQLKRFEGHIQLEVDVDDDLLDLYTINLLLQPLVENAIIHGLEHKIGGGEITVKGYSLGDILVIEVMDNGVGTDQDTVRQLMDSDMDTDKGLLLRNLNKRIKLYFGDDYGIAFYSQVGHGTTVKLILPKQQSIPKWRDYVEIINRR